MFRFRFAIVAIVKDEGASIFEWMAHHAALGCDRFILYDNGSTDGTRSEVRAFTGRARVELIEWPMAFGQLPAYRDAITRFGAVCDWMAFIDADEFLMPLRGERLLRILADFREQAGLAVPWAVFGSSGYDRRPVGLVLETYLKRAEDSFPINAHVKCIVQPGRVDANPISPHLFLARTGAVVLEDGTPVAPEGYGLLPAPIVPARLRINHYVVKSREDYELKAARGLAIQTDARDDFHFSVHDRNEVTDDSALSFVPAIRAAIARRRSPGVRRWWAWGRNKG